MTRDRRTTEESFGTVYEAGPERQFVTSPSETVHKRPESNDGDGYALDPVCGQTLPSGSLWGGIDAESAEAVATEYHKTRFCSKCFTRSLHLERLGRTARDSR